MRNLPKLETNLKIKFKNKELLALALVHRSYLNEVRDKKMISNERLEFLGDAILSFAVSRWLYEKYPQYPEGKLTNFRSNVVRTTALAAIARQLNLGQHLLLSRGEKASGGQDNPSLLANTLEAVIGAIFLDQGIEGAENFIRQNFKNLITETQQKSVLKDHKSLLQEKIQAQQNLTPSYRTLSEKGPDHDKEFTVGVFVAEKQIARGTGKSKQLAEEAAAQEALKNL